MKTTLQSARYVPQVFVVISILILSFGCDAKKPAIGNEDEIFVIADSSDYYELEGALIEVFEKVIYTPQPENLFLLKRKNFGELNSIKNKKNIIIVAPLNSNSEVAAYIKSILDSTVYKFVEADSEFVFNKYNLWSGDQLVMILTSTDVETLQKNILESKVNLVHYFTKISNKRLYQSLYNAKYEKRDVEARLLDKYGWIIYVQADFHLALDKSNDNFVWLRRAINTDMERWIFIHWIDNGSPAWLNEDSVLAIRNRMTQKFYVTTDGNAFVEVSKEQTPTISEVNFKNNYALLTQGFWRFSDKSGGGPFLSYTFYDELTKRIYMLDGSVYAPKYYKKNLIQQVDVTLQSFMTKSELSQNKIDELMDELD